MRTGLSLSARQWEKMRRHVAGCAPLEACGLLAGKGSRVESVFLAANAAQSPARFRMDLQEQLKAFNQIEARGLELVGIFHSHPAGPGRPSPTDVAEAAYPVVHLIWFVDGEAWRARGFWIEAGRVSEVDLYVLPSE